MVPRNSWEKEIAGKIRGKRKRADLINRNLKKN
jgi:hypothetical protein